MTSPENVSNEEIMSFLDTKHPHVVPRSNVILGRIPSRDNRHLSAFYNGDRIVYVKGDFHPVLPTSATVSGDACKIWHINQKLICKRCNSDTHRTTEVKQCDAYDASSTNGPFRVTNNHLSNFFYRCNINIYDRDWVSSEEILEAPHAAAAKVIANRIPSEQLKNWGDDKKLAIMHFILREKVNQCPKFKRALIAGGKNTFAR